MKITSSIRIALTLSTALLLVACGGNGNKNFNASSDEPITDLNDAEVAGLLFMREEEELARDLYLNIFEATGEHLQIFKNISDKAESKHAEAIRLLLVRADIEDPSTGQRDTYTDPELQHLYDTLYGLATEGDDVATLRVGALVEETDIRDIKTFKDQVSEDHQEIINTYDNLLCGSRNHLRAFVKQIEDKTGSTYEKQVPELAEEVDAILGSDKERCGK